MCFFKIPLGMNFLSQDSQIRVLKMAFLQCGRLCASQRFQLTWTFFTGFTKSGPENDFSPVWKTMWFFKIVLDMNFLSHYSQIRVLKLAFLQYGKLCASLRLHLTWTFCHIIHKSGSWKNGFSPVWKTMCFFKIPLDMNFLSQDSQILVLKMTFLHCDEASGSLGFCMV